MPLDKNTIKVTVDKSHLVTLGERLYVEAVELFRELIANAYDADATQVHVQLGEDVITVEDNGSGMSCKGLEQYFNIGSPEKRAHHLSPRFSRKRIGQFGIGKFAVLTAADEFLIETRRGKWLYEVCFSKSDWKNSTTWELPLHKEAATPLHARGTKVTLRKLKKRFTAKEVEHYLQEILPLRARKFTVFLNGQKIMPRLVIGRTHSFRFQTIFGVIEGEITIALNPKEIKEPGLECRVKGMLVKRSLLGLDPRLHGIQKITGWVEADFLPVTSGRNDFVSDSQEYKIFRQLVRAELEKVLGQLKSEIDSKELKIMQEALKEVLDKIRYALKMNQDLAPRARVLARRKKEMITKEMTTNDESSLGQGVKIETAHKSKKQMQEKSAPVVKKQELKPETTVIKRFRLAKLGFSCGFARLGEDGPEVLSEANIIYINQDHPVYRKLYAKKELLALHLLRLITQELALMKKLRLSAREAFTSQSRLLKDALTR